VLLGALLAGSGYKEVPPPAKVVLPPPQTPAQSLAAIQMPADLEIELVAAEPLVLDPVDLAWGPDGRMWVVEMADYPAGMDGAGQPGGRVRVLESTRGDGKFDRSTMFADGLRSPTSVLPWRDGVLVVAVPHLLFLRDTNGDGRADTSERVFSGFGEGNEQHLVNGLQWGLEGWLHMANGNSGGKVTSPRLGRAVELGQRDFRLELETGEIELLAGQSQAGRNRDDWGNWFGCNNSNPIWHFALEERYLRRNPHLVPPNATVTVAAIPGAARVYPRSQTLARFNDGFAANHFTSVCGTMIYRDDLLGPEYAGNVFVCEPVHNLVHREQIRPEGATFRSERAPREQTSEFLASTDNWARFVAVRAGPDGALYVADMYRLVIEHPKWIPEAWQKQLGDLRAGADRGRIYRIRPKGRALRAVPRLDRADPAGLVAALGSPSGLVRDLAQQQLMWRGAKSAAGDLEKLSRQAERPASRLQALWTLRGLGVLDAASVTRALRDPHPGVRRQAVRLSEDFSSTGAAHDLEAALVALVDDPDAGVRQQLAYTLGEWKSPAAGAALARLFRTNDDRFIRAAAMSSALPHADTLLAALGAAGETTQGLVMEIAAATENARALGALLAGIAAPPAAAGGPLRQFSQLAQLLDWLQRNNKSLAQLAATGGESLRESLTAADRVFDAARRSAADGAASIDQRAAAVRLLGRGRSRQQEDFELLSTLLAPQVPGEIQIAAATALGRFNRPATPERLLAGWGAYGPRLRSQVLDLVTSRPAWAQVLLDRAEKDPELLAQIDAGRRTTLTQHANVKLAERAAAIFGTGIDANRQKVIDRYLAAVPGLQADVAKGAAVFTAACSACHQFGAVPGRPVGPDLAVVKDRSAPYLVTHILDPNRALEDRYVFYTATLHDGRTPVGMLVGEASNSITLLGLDGVEQTILRSELRTLVSSGRSLMPEGLEAALDEQAMADLVAFLARGGER